uniref:Putative secreted protein n=1 Tax=Anopheles marajoara TaxID=58244 RepID=A0A2M4C7L2_9DIPT
MDRCRWSLPTLAVASRCSLQVVVSEAMTSMVCAGTVQVVAASVVHPALVVDESFRMNTCDASESDGMRRVVPALRGRLVDLRCGGRFLIMESTVVAAAHPALIERPTRAAYS